MVACVDGSAVTAAEVAQHLRAGVSREGALEAALRVRVFAAEAARRGLALPGDLPSPTAEQRRTLLHQTLIADVVATFDPIDAGEARRYYEAHPGEFNKITTVDAQAITVADRAHAERLAGELRGADDAAFAGAGGVDVGDALQDPALVKVAVNLRARGALAGPAELADGRFVLLRAREVEMTVAPFDDAIAAQVENHLARTRELAALDELYARLRAAHTIQVLDAELALLPVR